VSGSWIADSADVERSWEPFHPACEAGDWLVALIGFEPGAIEWIENWGEPPQLDPIPYV
jgi:hypothetical protein